MSADKPTTIRICAKCSDMFSASLISEGGGVLGELQGYVPKFFPGEHYGDYVIMSIDIASGRIIDWKKPTNKDLEIFYNEDVS